MSETTKSQN